MTYLKRLSLALVSGVLVACSPTVPQGASIIEVNDAFVVMPAEGRDVTGAGMDITIQGPDRMLIDASSTIAKKIEIHSMEMIDNQMKMRRVDGFVVTEDQPLKLERGGKHLMLFGVEGPLTEGDQVDILLTFSDGNGGEIDILTEAEVVSPAG